MKIKIILFIFLFSSSVTQAGESFIPLEKGVRLPSDDLVYGSKVLTSKEAQDLSKLQNSDLSQLNPKPNEVWSTEKTILDDQEAIELQENESVTFEGALSSNSGLYRFNAISHNSSKIFTIHLDKTLHTLLLRKNILRQLGYKIPAIKYLKKISIEFKNLEDREKFLKKDIPENTLGESGRWVKNINELTLDLYDIAVTEPSENDFYNVAMGLPTQTINSRTLRSLIIPYSLLDLYESVNKFSWIDGKIDNGSVVLSHFTGNDFATTIEDAQWMIRKLNILSRDNFKAAIDQAYFPEDVSGLILEKIISRRNSLNHLFSEHSAKLKVDQNISIGNSVKEGKIIQKNYPGYASRFAFGDAESPFDQIRYYLYSKIQSGVINNIISKFNSYLSVYDIGKTRKKFFQKQFEDGLNHFVATGEIAPIGIGTWLSPIGNARLILSRDIMLGNYLGTENLVQLADTFGAIATLGAHLGVEGFGNNLAGSVRATTSVLRTFTHLKPVKDLKQSLKEPFKNVFVTLLKKSLRDQYFSLSELKNSTESNTEKSKKIQNIFKEIDLNLGTGESLVMTDSLVPTTNVNLNFNSGLVGVGLGVGAQTTTIKRIHILKKSPKILQIYDDKGFVTDINVSFQVSEYVPLLKITGKYDKGHYNLKSYQVNLSSDLDENPNLFTNSLGVYNVLKNKDFELLDTVAKPISLKANFLDRTTILTFLFWKLKGINGKTYYDIEAQEGINGSYFSAFKDSMYGINSEGMVKKIANYYLTELTKDNVSVPSSDDKNPGDSFFGRSTTKSVRFEASLNNEKKFEHKFLTLSDSKHGWAISPKRLVKMMNKVNKKFDTIFFETGQIDFTQLKLFEVGYHLNLYDRGIEKLNELNIETIAEIENQNKKLSGCVEDDADEESSNCMTLEVVKENIQRCQNTKTEEELALCNMDLLDNLFLHLSYNDFKNIIGTDNMYIYGTVDGFRKQSEILNETIFSNTIGKIGSREWNGPLDIVRKLLGLSPGEFSGGWLREII